MLKRKKRTLAILTVLLALLFCFLLFASAKQADAAPHGTARFVMLDDEACVGAYLQFDIAHFDAEAMGNAN